MLVKILSLPDNKAFQSLAGKAFLCKQGNKSPIFLSPQQYNDTHLFVKFFPIRQKMRYPQRTWMNNA